MIGEDALLCRDLRMNRQPILERPVGAGLSKCRRLQPLLKLVRGRCVRIPPNRPGLTSECKKQRHAEQAFRHPTSLRSCQTSLGGLNMHPLDHLVSQAFGTAMKSRDESLGTVDLGRRRCKGAVARPDLVGM